MNIKQNLMSYSKQRGATMWTTITVALMVGFLAMIAFKLYTPYYDHYIIKSTVQKLVNEREFSSMSARQAISSLNSRMTINNIRNLSKDAFKFKKTKSGERFIIINYSQKVPVIGNVSALVEFNEEIRKKKD